MSVAVNPKRLERELARRALSASDLARLSGLSAATITAALAGRPLATRSLERIATVLADVPSVAVIDTLIGSDGPALDSLG